MNISISRVTPAPKVMAGAFAALTLALTGCASTYGPNTVSPSAVNQRSSVYYGTVSSVRQVTIKPERSLIGTATGAVLGGLAGSELGGGDKAQTAGAIGGAVLGGIAGNEAGKAVGTKQGYAYVVTLENGRTMEIVQNIDTYFAPGTPIVVTESSTGIVTVASAY